MRWGVEPVKFRRALHATLHLSHPLSLEASQIKAEATEPLLEQLVILPYSCVPGNLVNHLMHRRDERKSPRKELTNRGQLITRSVV